MLASRAKGSVYEAAVPNILREVGITPFSLTTPAPFASYPVMQHLLGGNHPSSRQEEKCSMKTRGGISMEKGREGQILIGVVGLPISFEEKCHRQSNPCDAEFDVF